jgi:hypothetical protein
MPRAQMLSELQDLIGRAKNGYLNDRSPERADIVIPALERAFDIVIKLRSGYKR